MSEEYRKEFDIRVVGYNLTRGKISREEYDAFLETLPDSASNALESNVRIEQIIAARQAQKND